MKNKNVISVWFAFMAVVSFAILTSCIDYAEQGEKAAAEFCDCLDEGYSESECEKRFRKNYDRAEYMNDDFISAFNAEGKSCGVTATKYK